MRGGGVGRGLRGSAGTDHARLNVVRLRRRQGPCQPLQELRRESVVRRPPAGRDRITADGDGAADRGADEVAEQRLGRSAEVRADMFDAYGGGSVRIELDLPASEPSADGRPVGGEHVRDRLT